MNQVRTHFDYLPHQNVLPTAQNQCKVFSSFLPSFTWSYIKQIKRMLHDLSLPFTAPRPQLWGQKIPTIRGWVSKLTTQHQQLVNLLWIAFTNPGRNIEKFQTTSWLFFERTFRAFSTIFMEKILRRITHVDRPQLPTSRWKKIKVLVLTSFLAVRVTGSQPTICPFELALHTVLTL